MRTVLPEEISRHMGKRGEEQQAPNINLKGERGALRVRLLLTEQTPLSVES